MTQKEAIDLMLEGKSVFLTGEPGAGKTYTLNQFIDYARQLGKRIAITASTGIAASHIDGMTIHSWSGLGIAEEISDRQLEEMSWKPYIRDKYHQCDILIIDEISMLHGRYLDMVERACRWIRRSDKPFGGLQVVLVGDLFQLPPVTKEDEELDYVHHSQAWAKTDLEVCYLTEQHRQGADDKLLTLLRAMRQGDFTTEQRSWLDERLGVATDDSITRLYTHNIDVDVLNNRKLQELNAGIHLMKMNWDGDNYKVMAMKRGVLAPQHLQLAVGAEVMFVANNWDEGYVNGTRGRVVGFEGRDPLVETHDGDHVHVQRHTWRAYDESGQIEIAKIIQYPLRLAWAVTIHKSQGMSLDEAEIDLSKAFTPGMGYVALSRVRSLEGLHLAGLGDDAFRMDEDIREFDKLLRQGKAKV